MPEARSNEVPSAAESANEAFKRSYGNWISAGLIAAVAMHFAFVHFFPDLQASEIGSPEDPTTVVPPPVPEIPPPPDEIARPALPVVPDAEVDDDLTIPRTTPEANPAEELGPPPSGDAAGDRPVWIPRDVEPQLTNDAHIQRVLERQYPPMLRDAGIGGRVILWLLVDEDGQVEEMLIQEPSDYEAFDEAARQVAREMEFRPAQNRDQPVAVWIAQPITFRVQD